MVEEDIVPIVHIYMFVQDDDDNNNDDEKEMNTYSSNGQGSVGAGTNEIVITKHKGSGHQYCCGQFNTKGWSN